MWLDTPIRVVLEWLRAGGIICQTMSLDRNRCANEKKFGSWTELPTGGRRYFLEVPGLHGWTARYVKEVDAEETTLRFLQEIYDEARHLVEIHEKYPIDKGMLGSKGECHDAYSPSCRSETGRLSSP